MMNRFTILLCEFWLFCLPLISQQYTSIDNRTGFWESPSSWTPAWPVPQTNVSGYNITIKGYITANSSIHFSGTASTLHIDDTLVIKGDLILDNNNDLHIRDNGILIVRGNLYIQNHTNINAEGYLIVTGNVIKGGTLYHGSFRSNDDPVKVFIGGSIIPSLLTHDMHDYPVLDCRNSPTSEYPNSGCTYGNMSDVVNDPIYDFFLSTCTLVTPVITADGPMTFCAGGGVTLTSSPEAKYFWSTGETTSSIHVTGPGSYTVKVRNSSGCQSGTSIVSIVTVNDLPATPGITPDGPTSFCAGDQVRLTSSAAESYLWSDGSNTPGITVSQEGSYSLRVMNANGCVSAVSTEINVQVNSLPVVNAGLDTTIAHGTYMVIDATITGDAPFAYSWSPDTQLEDATLEDPTTKNLIKTTVYSLTATSASTGCSNSDEVTITISGFALNVSPTASPGIICAGEKVKLHAIASGGTGFYEYSWTSVPAGFTSSAAQPTVHPALNTDYWVMVFDGFNTVNNHVNVTVNTLPPTPSITADGPITFCQGNSVSLTSSPGTAYKWSNGSTTPVLLIKLSGSYSVRTMDENGCESNKSQEVVVSVNKTPITPTIKANGPTSFCEGDSVLLTSSPGANYEWSRGDTSSGIQVTASGSYTVTVLSASGCKSAASVAIDVTANANPDTPIIVASGPLKICQGENVILATYPIHEYTWSTGQSSQYISVDTAGDFTVQVRNANGCQSPVSSITTVEVAELPMVRITSDLNAMCTNDTRPLTGIPEGGTFLISDGPGVVGSNVLSATESGYIDLIYTYSNYCANSDTQSIRVNGLPLVDAGPDQVLDYVFESQMNAGLMTGETGEWFLVSGTGNFSDSLSPVSAVTGLSIGENTFLWRITNGNCSAEDGVLIAVNDLIIPSVITPNGDGANDFFEVTRQLGRVELMIFNAWGNEVYTNGNYLNDWNGKNNKGNDLPNDTYFYVLKFENGSVAKGSVLIKK
jgi:gliding motility-associated-like protein